MTQKPEAATEWAFTELLRPRCTGYCIGTASVETLIEDLACPVHGVAAQEKAQRIYADRQDWLDALAEADHD